MPIRTTIRTIQTLEQCIALRNRWPTSYSAERWVIGYTADWDSEACRMLDAICRPLKAERKALERWWTIDPVNLP